jgi:putative Holliday junction resolvase
LLINNELRVLAVDWGIKRIGLAISDPLQLFAIGLVTINNNSKFWKDFLSTIANYNIVKIIVGLPFYNDGTESDLAKKVHEFINELQSKTNVQIETIDERYSSKIAEHQIIESVKSKKKRQDKSLVDKMAAAVILQNYLDSIKK